MESREEAKKMIEAERARQQDREGWTHAHDDAFVLGQLRDAAWCYYIGTDRLWPFSIRHWYKPGTDRMRTLVKAGALAKAEMDRLERAFAAALLPTWDYGPEYKDYLKTKRKNALEDVQKLMDGIVESLAAHLRAEWDANYKRTKKALEEVGLGSAKVLESE